MIGDRDYMHHKGWIGVSILSFFIFILIILVVPVLVDGSNNSMQKALPKQCDPSEPCCDEFGNFKPAGYVCRSAHDFSCNIKSSSGCGGTAHEDRCAGSSAQCPNNDYTIKYDAACTGQTCVEESCSSSSNTYTPQRTCQASICESATPYSCQNNYACRDSTSCKNACKNDKDCAVGYTCNKNTGNCAPPESKLYKANPLKYDKDGNLISYKGYNYDYNKLDGLTKIKKDGKVIATYVYDDAGNRIKKEEQSKKTTTYYIDDLVITVKDSVLLKKPTVSNTTFYWLNDRLIASDDDKGNRMYYYSDILGSPIVITDSNGDEIKRLNYDPFGKSNNLNASRYQYTSQELDTESEMLYMNARYYNPSYGKFTQPDKVLLDIYNPQQLNKYSYVLNNPYKYIDRSGRIGMLAGLFLGASNIFGVGGTMALGAGLLSVGVGMGLNFLQQSFSGGGVDFGQVGRTGVSGFVGNVAGDVTENFIPGIGHGVETGVSTMVNNFMQPSASMPGVPVYPRTGGGGGQGGYPMISPTTSPYDSMGYMGGGMQSHYTPYSSGGYYNYPFAQAPYYGGGSGGYYGDPYRSTPYGGGGYMPVADTYGSMPYYGGGYYRDPYSMTVQYSSIPYNPNYYGNPFLMQSYMGDPWGWGGFPSYGYGGYGGWGGGMW